jgi:hypothetical protein
VTSEPYEKIDPGSVIRARLRRNLRYVESGRCRNPNELAQIQRIAVFQREQAIDELKEWVRLCEEAGVNH